MALVIKEVSSNTVTEVGNVIIIEGGGLTPTQSAKLDNVPSDTITELANKVDKSGTKVLSDVNYTVGDKSKVNNVPVNTNSSISAINSSISTINTNLAGKADLDPDTNKLSLEQLPEGYNNVVEAANLAAFPGTGVANTIYVALDTNLTYRWSGTQYTEVSQSLALGETSASAYRGDRGAAAYTHSQATGNPHGLALSDISTNLEDKSSEQIRSEITETDIPVEIARTTAIPTTTTPLTDTSAKRFVTDIEKATWNNKAEPGDFAAAISITGTHDETTTAINFSTNQGYAITLTADRTFTVSTGLSASNPIGLLKITHAGFTPTFTGVVVLDSPVDKSGVYYLKFTRQADGTITQSNQSGGGATTLAELDTTVTGSQLDAIKNTVDSIIEITKITESTLLSSNLLAGNTTPIQLKATPGAGKVDELKQVWAYVNFGTAAYTTNQILEIYTGSTVVAECDCLGATASGWHLFTILSIPEANQAMYVRVRTGDPLAGDSDVGIYLKYVVADEVAFSWPVSIIEYYDDFSDNSLGAEWTNQAGSNVGFAEQNQQWEWFSVAAITSREINYLEAQTIQNDLIIIQAHITSPSEIALLWRFGMTADENSEGQDYFFLGPSTTVAGTIRIFVRDTGVITIDETGVLFSGGMWFREKYKPSTGLITYEYWHSVNEEWTSLGSHININMGSTVYPYFGASADAASSSSTIVDNFYVSFADYATELPI